MVEMVMGLKKNWHVAIGITVMALQMLMKRLCLRLMFLTTTYVLGYVVVCIYVFANRAYFMGPSHAWVTMS